MGLKKNVASQKVVFVMVDKTDFATPEPGITVQGGISKDGAAKASITNSVSEIYSGLYVLTLTNSETNADVVALRLHDGGTACATQHIVERTDTLESAIDSAVAGPIASILVDTKTTLDDKLDSVLADTKEINSQCDSILADTMTLSNATYGLDALETIASDILEALDSVTAGPIASILIDTNATLDDKIDSILVDTKEINSQADSILADTQTLSNATYGLDALETITSDILEALDSVTAGPIASILVDTNATLDNKIDSILADTKTSLPSIISNLESTLDSAIDGPLTSVLADTKTAIPATISAVLSTIDSQTGDIASILADTKTTIPNALEGAVDNGLDNAISAPTLGSSAWYLLHLGRNIINKMVITEANGNTEFFHTDNSTLGSVNARYTTDGTDTVRLLGVP